MILKSVGMRLNMVDAAIRQLLSDVGRHTVDLTHAKEGKFAKRGLTDVVFTILDYAPEVVCVLVEVLAQLSALTREAESCFPEDFREQKLREMLGTPRLAYSALRALRFLGPKAPVALLPEVTKRLADGDANLRTGAAALREPARAIARAILTDERSQRGSRVLGYQAAHDIDQLVAMLKSSDVGQRAARGPGDTALATGPRRRGGLEHQLGDWVVVGWWLGGGWWWLVVVGWLASEGDW
eukprot:Skav227308  [mRNA]  locus=scaffold2645:345534:349033:- [translate_table: standard]